MGADSRLVGTPGSRPDSLDATGVDLPDGYDKILNEACQLNHPSILAALSE
jgi:hypothetical protein